MLYEQNWKKKKQEKKWWKQEMGLIKRTEGMGGRGEVQRQQRDPKRLFSK